MFHSKILGVLNVAFVGNIVDNLAGSWWSCLALQGNDVLHPCFVYMLLTFDRIIFKYLESQSTLENGIQVPYKYLH